MRFVDGMQVSMVLGKTHLVNKILIIKALGQELKLSPNNACEFIIFNQILSSKQEKVSYYLHYCFHYFPGVNKMAFCMSDFFLFYMHIFYLDFMLKAQRNLFWIFDVSPTFLVKLFIPAFLDFFQWKPKLYWLLNARIKNKCFKFL